MMESAFVLGGLAKLAWFAIGAFVFSAIFWLTHNWLADYKGKKKRRKR